jgi:arylsulfatase A-like enzyme
MKKVQNKLKDKLDPSFKFRSNLLSRVHERGECCRRLVQYILRPMKLSVSSITAGSLPATMFLINLTSVSGNAQDMQLTSDPPNIIWLTIEDISPNLGAYGDTFAHTPNIDAFSKMALRYNLAWSTSPVCSPARTAIISGMYPTTLGGHNHRSEVGLPQNIVMYPELLKELGYYVTNNSKEEYNLVHADGDRDIWHDSSGEAHYYNRPDKGMPFFAVYNGFDSHGSNIRNRTGLPFHNPDDVTIPPFHPDTPAFRRDWAQYYHSITLVDEWFGRKLDHIRDDGLMDNTIIFFYSDHGGGMPAYKTLAYNRGLQVPMLVYIPEKYLHLAPQDYRAGGSTNRPVEFVDLAPTLLSLVGAEPPEWMQGMAFMGHFEAEPRKYLFGSRGRMDEQIDMVRSVRDERYIYIRNYMPHLKHGFFNEYSYTFESTNDWRSLHFAGELLPPQARYWEPKPPEELYDLIADPYELHNLVDCTYHQQVLDRLRAAHRQHMVETRDVQFLPESEMHRRAKNSTSPIWKINDKKEVTSIFEMAQDPKRYEMERIFAMAELAADYNLQSLPMLEIGLSDKDPAVRYWAAMGILIRGKRAFDVTESSVRAALEDPNPGVRVVASNIFAVHAVGDDRQKALDQLVELAKPDKYGVYVALEALNVLKNLDFVNDSIIEALLENEKEDPDAIWRGANQYINRLLPDFIHPYNR